MGAERIAFNCSQPEVMGTAIRAAVAVTDLPIGVYANVFEVGEHDGANATINDLRLEVTPEMYLDFAERWVAAGASMVGGCCGVGICPVPCRSAARAANCSRRCCTTPGAFTCNVAPPIRTRRRGASMR